MSLRMTLTHLQTVYETEGELKANVVNLEERKNAKNPAKAQAE